MFLAAHNVIAGFLRRTWLVALVTVVVCASFAARAVAALSDAALAPGASGAPGVMGAPPVKAPPASTAPVRRPLPADGDAFVTRNIFCSSCAPGPGPGPEYQGHPAVLIATSIGADPRATVRVVPTEVQGSWGLGEEIPGVGRLDQIESTAIAVIDAAGHEKRISLLTTAAGPDCGAATPCGRPAAGKPGPYADRIEKVDETTYAVERALVRELVMGTTKDRARALPVTDANGEITGIRLIGATPSTVACAIGLRSGDLISSIDGVPLRTAQQMIDLFAKLDQVSAVELGGKRGGKPIQLTLRLR